eukprot:TRINITY_DN44313_c0_g1_i1.p1 TRINITY_DN44313_c0_g1~~TRINITY_DN44313_c0_g1_i1.p1  ORF type:complete len:435 (+),score=85.34 TRINITY_DN44313_c0_g1_i1:44-1306(+)
MEVPQVPFAFLRHRPQRCTRVLALSLLVSGALQCQHWTFLPLRSALTRTTTSSPLVEQARWSPVKLRGPQPMRVEADPVNNVSPEVSAKGEYYARKYEDIYVAGYKLWEEIKKNPKLPRKVYFIGTNGNNAKKIAQALMEALAYIPAPDGTMMMRRKGTEDYPEIVYGIAVSDEELARKTSISAVDLYMDDEKEYRRLELEAIKEFAEEDYGDIPAALVVGESALDTPEVAEIVSKGLVIWCDADMEWTWSKTQYQQATGGFFVRSGGDVVRPPVWAIANGWDGDVDDAEGKLEYLEILEGHRKTYEKLAHLRIRTDITSVAENPTWGAERLTRAIAEHFGIAGEAVVEEEILENDLSKFLEGARLAKYLQPALAWCNEQGAATIEELVENVDDFSESLGLKPLEKKRLVKAAESVAAAM